MPNRLLELYDKKTNYRLGGIAAIFLWQYTFTVTVFTILVSILIPCDYIL